MFMHIVQKGNEAPEQIGRFYFLGKFFSAPRRNITEGQLQKLPWKFEELNE